jgi:hypothetical protein
MWEGKGRKVLEIMFGGGGERHWCSIECEGGLEAVLERIAGESFLV